MPDTPARRAASLRDFPPGAPGLIISKLLLAALARRTSAFGAKRTLTLDEEWLNGSKIEELEDFDVMATMRLAPGPASESLQ